jgi:hypothetical protein
MQMFGKRCDLVYVTSMFGEGRRYIHIERDTTYNNLINVLKPKLTMHI